MLYSSIVSKGEKRAMINSNLEKSLENAVKKANDFGHQYASTEHLLLVLCDNPDVKTLLQACGAAVSILKRELTNHLKRFKDETNRTKRKGEATPSQAFWRAKAWAERFVGENKTATGAHVVAALFHDQESKAVELLELQNITMKKVMQVLASTLASDMQAFAKPERKSSTTLGLKTSIVHEREQGDRSPLDRYAKNLNEKALAGKIIPLIGRDDELESMISILCQTRKNNPLLLGEPGVGKTAIAEGLAWMIVNSLVPNAISKMVIYALDLGSLMADTGIRGEFEKRIEGILRDLESRPGSILFIDEIHMIVGAGSTSGNTMDLANMIKPMLASGELTCIGATTYNEYRKYIEKDGALSRRFQVVDIPVPTPEKTVAILEGLKPRLETQHGVNYTHEALCAAVELSERYMTSQHLPDKAIDIIDQAGAHYQVYNEGGGNNLIGVKEIQAVVSKKTKVPLTSLTKTGSGDSIKHLEENLKRTIYGQDQAIESVCARVKLSKSGLGDDNKPVGSFLFAGPTGVGKTELCKQLAELLEIKLIRFDMSEFMEKHAVSKLIGAPPGYVGYDQPGMLTDAVSKTPHCVLLLDEIEKAHPDTTNLLLQIMDHGTLSDSAGKKVDFTEVFLVLTTNAGAEALSHKSIGFTKEDHADEMGEGIARAFAPELRNRLDAIIQFNPLEREVIHHVVDKFIRELQDQLLARKVSLEVSQTARDWFALHGYDRNMGARPMKRLIQDSLKRPLADELLFGKLVNGGKVCVSLTDDGSLEFSIM
jgi:ATP-dependent Clp protease ATP-binding subunit ClpA